jgi:hypothetical protein
MNFRASFLFVALVLGATVRLCGQDAPVTLSNEFGATITFTPHETGWSWTGLVTPGVADARSITDQGTALAVNDAEDRLAADWTLMPSDSSAKLVFEQDAPAAGVRYRRIYSFGPGANALRIETSVRSLGAEKTLTRAGLLDIQVAGEAFRETGAAPASFPLYGRGLFVGIEHVSGVAQADGETAHLAQTPHLKVGADWQVVTNVVVGWPLVTDSTLINDQNRIRAAFLQYLDDVRIKPANVELHTNTWWTLPLPFAEKNVLTDIDALRHGFADRTGMFFDSFALDLGWSDPHSIWRINAKNFPNGFRAINDRLAASGARLGIWASPGSAYPEGLDNAWLAENGYELTPFGDPSDRLNKVACFALGGRYQREFKANLLQLVRDYGIRHVKLDFMAHRCDVPTHGHPVGVDSEYAIDAGLADVLDSLRAINPDIVLEPLCCGYPPSPWWLMHTPYVLGPDGDDVPYGRVASPDWMESLITARDINYRASQESWIMPTTALETFDIVVQTPGRFENLAVMAIGRGRSFISTYLKPELMTPENWDFLASLVRWTRANRQYLDNAQQIGGRPENREAYGYMFHNPSKDIYCARNPWIEERPIDLPVDGAVTEARELRMIYPRRETLARLEPGQPAPRITLAAYETVMLETVPAGESTPAPAEHASLQAEITADNPWAFGPAESGEDTPPETNFVWDGTLTVPDITNGELCILVEGAPRVNGAVARITLNDREVNAVKSTSAGQFGAAGAPSPDNWTWFIAPISSGTKSFHLEVNAPLDRASFGVYLRGTSGVADGAAPEGAVFPEFHPGSRNWSQTLWRLKEYPDDASTVGNPTTDPGTQDVTPPVLPPPDLPPPDLPPPEMTPPDFPPPDLALPDVATSPAPSSDPIGETEHPAVTSPSASLREGVRASR